MMRQANNSPTTGRAIINWAWLAGVAALLQLPAWGSQSVSLKWIPSPDTNVVGYKIYYGITSRTYTNAIPVGNVTNTIVSGLAGSSTYYFAATTYAANGAESVFSNEAIYNTQADTVTNSNSVVNTATNSNSVAQVNLPPTLNPIGNLVINENSGVQTVNLAGISSGTTGQVMPLTVTAVSSNPGLIPNPTVNYSSPNGSGTLNFAPLTYSNGTANITVWVNNGQAQSNLFNQTFTVTVAAVNQPPTLNPLADLVLIKSKNAPTQTISLTGISSGAPNEHQTLTITAVSSNPSLVSNPTVSYSNPNATGKISFTPKANNLGASIITVTVNDGGQSNNIVTQQFVVNLVSQLPTGSSTPTISSITPGQYAAVGQNTAFNVAATGSGPMFYQWKYNGSIITSATNAQLNLQNIKLNQAGTYTVSVANSAGSVISPGVNLTVYPTAAANLIAAAAASGQFGFNVSGVPGYQYAVQVSSDLVHWTSVQTNQSPFPFTDTNAGQFNQRYYRTVYPPR